MENFKILKSNDSRRKIVLSGVNAHSANFEILKNIFQDWNDDEIESLRNGGASESWWEMIGDLKRIDFVFEPLENYFTI
jgi:hypothetical protein